jgi:GntR family transcriptional repressor for pyruvate dehydrogenase complex
MNMVVFQPITHEPTAQAVVRLIENLILEGVLRPGERLPAERNLAKELNVSRPILREALASLIKMGLIYAKKGEGTFISDMVGSVFAPAIMPLIQRSEAAFEDYLHFRRMIEGTAAALACERATDVDFEILANLREDLLDAHEEFDPEREARLDFELHTAIVEATHNSILLHVLRSCYQLLADHRFMHRDIILNKKGTRERFLADHLNIIDALFSRDANAARQASEIHLDNVIKELARAQDYQLRAERASRRLALRSTSASARHHSSNNGKEGIPYDQDDDLENEDHSLSHS